MTRFFCFASIVLILISCEKNESQNSAKAFLPGKVTYQEHFILGREDASSSDELFGQVQMVTSSHDGNIYVADATGMTIKSFDKNGGFQNTIGNRGRGPGEFTEITCLISDQENNIRVVDSRGGQVSTFRGDGTLLSSHKVMEHNSENLLQYPRQAIQMKMGDFLFLYRPSYFSDLSVDKEYLIHQVNENLDSRTASFLSIGNIISTKDSYEYHALEFVPGTFTLLKNEVVAYAPSYYNGKIYVYQQNQGAWTRLRTISGYTRSQEALELLDSDAFSPVMSRIRAGNSYSAIVHVQSIGIHELSDGRLIHFIFVREGEGARLQVEVFSDDHTLQFVDYIEEFEIQGLYSASPYEIKWKDADDRFYMVDRRGAHKVYVFSLLIGDA